MRRHIVVVAREATTRSLGVASPESVCEGAQVLLQRGPANCREHDEREEEAEIEDRVAVVRHLEIEHPVPVAPHEHVLHREIAVHEAASHVQFLEPTRNVVGSLGQALDHGLVERAQALLLEGLEVVEGCGDRGIARRLRVPQPERLPRPRPDAGVRPAGGHLRLPVWGVVGKELHHDDVRRRIVVEKARHSSGREPSTEPQRGGLDLGPLLLRPPVGLDLEPRRATA